MYTPILWHTHKKAPHHTHTHSLSLSHTPHAHTTGTKDDLHSIQNSRLSGSTEHQQAHKLTNSVTHTDSEWLTVAEATATIALKPMGYSSMWYCSWACGLTSGDWGVMMRYSLLSALCWYACTGVPIVCLPIWNTITYFSSLYKSDCDKCHHHNSVCYKVLIII